jgi:serine/threonine protein kinase
VDKSLNQRLVGATVAGKYRIRRVVGAGSMGVVCEAEHLEIGKRLALKLIEASLVGASEIETRFRREARAASLVESQHIVQVFDVGSDDRLGLYLVMELLTGEDLASRLARERRIAPGAAVRIALQAARGLARAHDAGVIHRDLKPANIFLCARDDEEPLVKILDFGISKVVAGARAEPRLAVTRAGTVVGTPQYMSPEQARGGAIDRRTDVWALGLVLYEMVAGRPAYPEMLSYEEFIIHLVSNAPAPLRRVAPWVPTALADVVHQALAHELEARIASCHEFVRRLLAIEDAGEGARDAAVESVRPGVGEGLAEGLAEAVQERLGDRFGAAPPPARFGDTTDADDADDAPQFFDRRVLDRLRAASLAAAAGGTAPRATRSPLAGVVAANAADPWVPRSLGRSLGSRRVWARWAVFSVVAILAALALAFSILSGSRVR